MAEFSDERTRGLIRLAMLQTEMITALRRVLAATQSGPPAAIRAAYQEYFQRADALLAEAEPFERRWPGGFPLADQVQQLTDHLLIASDYRRDDGDRAGAQALRERAVQLADRHLGPGERAAIARWLATRAAAEGRFHEAIPALQDALAALTSAQRLDEATRACLDLANVWEWLGHYARALAVLDDVDDRLATELAEGPPTPAEVMAALDRQLASIESGQPISEGVHALALRHQFYLVRMARARVNRFMSRFDEAVHLFDDCRAFARENGVETAVVFHLASIALDRGQVASAAQMTQAIAQEFDRPDYRPRRASLRVLQADLMLQTGHPHEAFTLVQDGLADQAAYPDLDQEWRLRWREARAELGCGHPGEALAGYRRAAAAVDTLRTAPLGYELDSTYLENKLPMFVEAIEEAVRQSDGPSAMTLIERVKSRALSTVVSLPRSPHDTLGADEREFDDLCRQIDATAFAMVCGQPDAAASAARTDLLSRRDQLVERIRIRDPRWRALSVSAPLDVEQLPDYLRCSAAAGAPRRALVSIYRLPGRVVAVLADDSGVVVAAQDLARSVQDAVTSYVDGVRHGHDPGADDLAGGPIGQIGQIGLDDLVPPALVERALQAEVVLVAPHGQWHLLPWASLTYRGAPLFDRVAVGLLPSLGCLAALDVTSLAEPGVALIGDPTYQRWRGYPRLQAAGGELSDIAQLYGPRASAPLTGLQATETAFWSLCADPGADQQILHVACHAALDVQAPLASGLVLDDGIVDAAEVMLRRCPFPEVVLSACSTGWRPQAVGDLVLHGDDALGLPAAFLEAGAKFLLASVPKVDDEGIAGFMLAWHRHRLTAASPLAAYRAAQRELYTQQPDSAWAWHGVTAYGCR